MKTKRHILLLIIVFMLFGCKKEKEEVTNIEQPIQPFFTFGEVGNEWTYEHINVHGVQQDTTISMVKYVITEKNNNNLYTYKTDISQDDFQWYISSDAFGISENKIYVKKDSKVGDSYHPSCLILAVDEILYILNDSLSCFKVNTLVGLEPSSKILWINNKYGIVKIESSNEYDKDVYTLMNTNF
ncbi:MAG: hypothetical protein ABIJ97_07505 [Bacteroidota bacterium]